MDDYLTTSIVARMLGIAAETVRLWARTGRLRAIRTTTGVRLYRRADAERLAAERAARQAAERGGPAA